MHNILKFQKMFVRWVPKELKDRDKVNQMGLSLQHLLRFADEGEDMLNKTVTGDESRVLDYQPNSKHASMQWKYRSLSSTKKLKVTHTPSVVKFMVTCFLGFSRSTVSPFSEAS
jgi:hypothetical protein